MSVEENLPAHPEKNLDILERNITNAQNMSVFYLTYFYNTNRASTSIYHHLRSIFYFEISGERKSLSSRLSLYENNEKESFNKIRKSLFRNVN